MNTFVLYINREQALIYARYVPLSISFLRQTSDKEANSLHLSAGIKSCVIWVIIRVFKSPCIVLIFKSIFCI